MTTITTLKRGHIGGSVTVYTKLAILFVFGFALIACSSLLVQETSAASKKRIDIAWYYGDIAYNMCKEYLAALQVEAPKRAKKYRLETCVMFQDAVESVIEVTGMNMANAISSWSEAAELAERKGYRKEGELALRKTLHWIFTHEHPKRITEEKIHEQYSRDAQQWLLNMAVKNDRNHLPDHLDYDDIMRKIREHDMKQQKEKQQQQQQQQQQEQDAAEATATTTTTTPVIEATMTGEEYHRPPHLEEQRLGPYFPENDEIYMSMAATSLKNVDNTNPHTTNNDEVAQKEQQEQQQQQQQPPENEALTMYAHALPHEEL